MLFTRIISFLFISSMLFGEIHVFNRSSGTESEIKTLLDSKKLYISAKDLSRSLSSRLYENAERKKLVLYIADRKVKISGNTSFIMIDDQPYQMSQITRIESNDLYVPAEAFFEILKSTVLPGINFDSKKEFLDIDVVRFNITGINIDVKSNGTIIRLTTRKPFSERNISSFINKHGWYYLTIAGAIVDTININNGITRGVIQRIESDQLGETAQAGHYWQQWHQFPRPQAKYLAE